MQFTSAIKIVLLGIMKLLVVEHHLKVELQLLLEILGLLLVLVEQVLLVLE